MALCLPLALLVPSHGAAQPPVERPLVPAAEGEPVETIALEELLVAASSDPPAVLTAKASYERALSTLSAARSGWLPSLSLQGTYGYAYDDRLVLPDAPRIQSRSIQAQGSATLEWVGFDLARSSRITGAEESAEAGRLAVASQQQAARLAAAELYFHALAAEELVADAELSLSRRQDQLQAIKALVAAGTRSPVDAERASFEVTSAEFLVRRQRVQERAARAALAAAVGRDPRTSLRPKRAASPRPRIARAEEAAEVASDRHPELARLDAEVASADAMHDARVRALLPVLGASLSGSITHTDVRRGIGIDGYQYGGTASVFLRFQGLDPTAWMQVDVAASTTVEAERRRDEMRNRIQVEAVAAYYDYEVALTERKRAEALLESAGRAREAQSGRYRSGLASLLELLDAESLAQQARRRIIETRRDEALAAVGLLAACGRL